MTNKRILRAFALLPCAALILGTSALQASTVRSDKFQIPFSFKAQNHVMAAGDYDVEQATGSDFVILTNRKTGERVRYLRPSDVREAGKARLVFENKQDGHLLKQIS
jgi:hypothetical protein